MSQKLTAALAPIALTGAYLAGSTATPTQDPPGMDENAMAMMQDLQTAHDNYMVPGPFHEKLEHFMGDWDVTVRVWMMGPDAAPAESKGVATVGWILGKRFAQETMSFNLMGMQMESLQITGYDNYRNQYVGNMYGSMSTEVIPMQGGVSPDGKTFDFYGTMHEPMLNVSGRMVRFLTTIKDETTHTVSVFDLHAGPDYKVLEFEYTRK